MVIPENGNPNNRISGFAPKRANETSEIPLRFYLENSSFQEILLIKGAKVNNLKNLDVAIPRDQLIVITGIIDNQPIS